MFGPPRAQSHREEPSDLRFCVLCALRSATCSLLSVRVCVERTAHSRLSGLIDRFTASFQISKNSNESRSRSISYLWCSGLRPRKRRRLRPSRSIQGSAVGVTAYTVFTWQGRKETMGFALLLETNKACPIRDGKERPCGRLSSRSHGSVCSVFEGVERWQHCPRLLTTLCSN